MRDAVFPADMPVADGYFAEARLPIGKAPRLAKTAFVGAVARSGLGRLTSACIQTEAGLRWLVLRFSLIDDGRGTLEALAAVLRGLGAPAETTLGHAECPGVVRIGAVLALPGFVAVPAASAPQGSERAHWAPPDGAAPRTHPFSRQARTLMREALFSARAPVQPTPRRLH